jgi:hypothetical protein
MRKAIVVTSINEPNAVLRSLASGAEEAGFDFILVGDTKSPADFALDGCDYFDIQRQLSTKFSFAQKCPTRHYARKNIGYLIAIDRGAKLIVETDDDNFPREEFFKDRSLEVDCPRNQDEGWLNVYGYFSTSTIWPRGLPLTEINGSARAFEELPFASNFCPIQQGLADENPDVDAIYRLVLPLPQNFRSDRRVALSAGCWSPFNSQNTSWWPQAYPLLYLPAYCSFRMTDIWRSFVAQRIAYENDWAVLFHEPTVWQSRNEHDLQKDFEDEVPGYLNNDRIKKTLEAVPLQRGIDKIPSNLRACYEALVDLKVVEAAELSLLEAWLNDLSEIVGPERRQ